MSSEPRAPNRVTIRGTPYRGLSEKLLIHKHVQNGKTFTNIHIETKKLQIIRNFDLFNLTIFSAAS